jgi:Transposase.
LGISYGICQWILNNKEHHVAVFRELFQPLCNDTIFLIIRIINGDENYIYSYDPEIKQKSSQWRRWSSPRLKKACQLKNKVKSMFFAFLWSQGIVDREFIPQNHTVNSTFYCDVLWLISGKVQKQWPELCEHGNWLFHHDNVPVIPPGLQEHFWPKTMFLLLFCPIHPPCLIWNPLRTWFPGWISKMAEPLILVSTCGRRILQWWWSYDNFF